MAPGEPLSVAVFTLLPFMPPVPLRHGSYVFKKLLKLRSASALPTCRPAVMSAVLTSLSVRTVHLTQAWPEQ